MAQGDIITPEVRKIIAEVWHEHALNGWAAKEIQAEVAKRVQNKWPGKYNPDWPGLRAVQARLPDIREKYESKDFQDLEAPWQLGASNDYPLPAGAIPYIHIVQDWLEKYPDWRNNPPPQKPLTIRQALWVARLYCGIKEISKIKRKHLPSVAHYLFLWAETYAQRERICELSKTPLDTTNFDKHFRERELPPITIGDKTTLLHYRDGSIFIDTIDKDLQAQMEQMKKEGEQ